MVIVQKGRVGIKPTGGVYLSHRGKRIFEKGSAPAMPNIAKDKISAVEAKFGNYKVKVFASTVANILDPKTKKYSKVKIKTVKENPANRHFVRQNTLTKGAILETELGRARVTSRPGQDGTVNAVLIG